MAKINLSTKLEPKTKEDWEKFIYEIQKQYNFKDKDEAYEFILNNFKFESGLAAPEIDGIIENVNTNLNIIRNSFLDIKGVYLTTIQQRDQKIQEETKSLVSELNEKRQTINDLQNALRRANGEINELNDKVKKLTDRNEFLEKNQNINEKILTSLDKLENFDLYLKRLEENSNKKDVETKKDS